MRRFSVAVPEGTREELAAVAVDHAEVERAWKAEQAEAAAFLMGAARRAHLRQVRLDLAAKREAGELLGSRGALVAHHLRAVLADRGLDKEWDPLPPGAVRRGRPTGRDHSEGEDRWPERVNVDLPDELAEQTVRAAHHVSAEAAAWLESFADRWGKGPALATNMLEMAVAALRGTPSPEELAERERRRAQIVTTGDLLREAIERAVRG